MSYLVLARKWRPRKFAEMVGQQHVLRALINALDSDRLHHAFLFTGTRGVGKTTVSRIFAKSLNCEHGVGSEPCGVCANCREIDEGRFVDLIEVDAASRTGVDDTRDLLENVQYAPARGRYKVYLIDEVHMFSKSSFNALLKTLEEPPPHVKFLLATTDPQKLPATILSRCLQFNLKRLSVGLIRDHLADLLGKELIAFEPSALSALAHAADGSMRDALSLLDQAIAFGSDGVKAQEVHEMLGTIDRARVVELLKALAAEDGPGLLAETARLAELGPDYRAVLEALIDLLHRLAMAQVLGAEGGAEEGDEEAAALLGELAAQLSAEEVQLYYQIALHARRDLPLVPDPRSGLEMALLRMLAFRPATLALPSAPAAPVASPSVPTTRANPTVASRPQSPPSRPTPSPAGNSGGGNRPTDNIRAMLGDKGGRDNRSRQPQQRPAQARPAPGEGDDEPAPARPPSDVAGGLQGVGGGTRGPSPFIPDPWEALCEQLALGGLVQQLAVNCTLVAQSEGQVRLALDPGCRHLDTAARRDALAEALGTHLGQTIALVLEQGRAGAPTPQWRQRQRERLRLKEAERLISEDPVVKELRKRFDVQLVADSVRALAGLRMEPPGE